MERLDLTDQELQKLRDISIHGVLGLQNLGRVMGVPCPLHGGRSSNSFFLYPDNSYHCFKCEGHGNNAIDFMKSLYPDRSFVDNVVELLKYL